MILLLKARDWEWKVFIGKNESTWGKKIEFFVSIPKSKIWTGLEKVKVKSNTLDVIKEDREAFVILVGKVQTPSKALKCPLTNVALALTEADQTLRQLSTKATLRRLLYKKSD